MKNLILSLSAILIVTSLYSCKRKYTCKCTTHLAATKEYTIDAKNKKEAAKQCPPEPVIAIYSCSIQ